MGALIEIYLIISYTKCCGGKITQVLLTRLQWLTYIYFYTHVILSLTSAWNGDPAGKLPTTHRSRQATPGKYSESYHSIWLPCPASLHPNCVRSGSCFAWPVRRVTSWQVSLVYDETLFNVCTCMKFDNQTKQKKAQYQSICGIILKTLLWNLL